MARSDVAPARFISRMIGSTLAACRFAFASMTSTAAFRSVPRPRCNHRSLLLCKRGEQVQDERVHIRAKLGDNEWHPLCHQAGDEMNVAAQTVELGDGNGATTAASLRERGGKLWSAVKRVRALAGFYFDELSENLEVLSHRKARKRLTLRFEAEAGAALRLR
jgi:hypothetical protein